MKTTETLPFRVLGQSSLIYLLLACIAVLAPVLSHAHEPGKSSLVLKLVEPTLIEGEYHVADVDLVSINLMLEDQFRLNQGSTGSPAFDPAAHGINALPFLVMEVSGSPVAITPGEPFRAEIQGDIHTVIPFSAAVPESADLTVRFDSFFGFDPQHRVVTSLELEDETKVGIVSQDDPAWEIPRPGTDKWGQFVHFTWEGVWHIWIGIDHILFLIALLLPSVLRYRDGQWVPVPEFHNALLTVLKVVTAFTIAHSVTLSLAALEIVMLPSKWVESVIALSVVLAALNNLYPVVSERVWMVAFGFGFIHGFGFANVLADLQLPTGTLAIALLSFNIGVELGQFAIVAVFFPAIFLLREWSLYQPLKLRAGSAVIALIAVGWIADRVFELEFMPF